jgi:hypothetical protein
MAHQDPVHIDIERHNSPATPAASIHNLTRAARELSETQLTRVVGGTDGPGSPTDGTG